MNSTVAQGSGRRPIADIDGIPDIVGQASKILHYWFGNLDDLTLITMSDSQVTKWHSKKPDVDAEIRQLFLDLYLRSRDELPPDSLEDPRTTLAQIILFDQFPRNMFRDTAEMYATDRIALHLCKRALERKLDESLPLIKRMFLYMPLMHSEDLNNQTLTVELFGQLRTLAESRSPQNVPFFEMSLGYAQRHHDIVEQFGRFPHRNGLLGRASTEVELAFLNEAGSSF